MKSSTHATAVVKDDRKQEKSQTITNRKLKRLYEKHKVKASPIIDENGDVVEFRFEKPLECKLAEIDYDENGEVRGYFFSVLDGDGNEIDLSEVASIIRGEEVEND